mmetsp:Transcript_25038/g.50317  ORF Transcript_25038/g.50317 Transcript_25038/m.50317 type:complete len:94 (+) Transcript_25038:636-917(+)
MLSYNPTHPRVTPPVGTNDSAREGPRIGVWTPSKVLHTSGGDEAVDLLVASPSAGQKRLCTAGHLTRRLTHVQQQHTRRHTASERLQLCETVH